MFDWARGSVLKKLIEAKITGAHHDTWLKGWSNAWPLALLHIPKGTKVLDVGTGSTLWYPQHFASLGCEVHILDRKYKSRKGEVHFGLSPHDINKNPQIKFHLGLAGQNKGPKNYFDLVTCISVIEHIYDHDQVLNPKNPFPHLVALKDMARMLAPGGVLAFTYDFFLGDMKHWRGWDYLADYELLTHMGLHPLLPDIKPQPRTFIYNHEDTLFMGAEGILSFSRSFIRSTSIGMIFVKPGKQKVKFSPHPECKDVLLAFSPVAEPPLKQFLLKKSRTISKNILNRFKNINR